MVRAREKRIRKVMVSFFVEAEILEEVYRIAESTGKYKSDVLRDALARGLRV